MEHVIAIVGRPNVGKSTLFNRMARNRLALVDDMPGVTRDRLYARTEWNGARFTVVDTGGFTHNDPDAFSARIHDQVRAALEEADAVLMVMDGKAGLSPFDQDLLGLVRPLEKPVFFAVNKVDSPEQEGHAAEFHALGISPVLTVSAEHGYGFSTLMDALTGSFPRDEEAVNREDGDAPRVAVIGRPNAGKSSLINQLLGTERLLVSEEPGTTRDAVDTVCGYGGRRYVFVDTAGIRRRSKVTARLEKFSVVRALKSLSRCDVALVLVDASLGLTDQDTRVAGYAYERGCGTIWVYNKWDLVDRTRRNPYQEEKLLRDAAPFLSFAPFLTLSAKTGQRVGKIFPLIDEVYRQYSLRVNTGVLNRILEDAVTGHEPPLSRGRRVKFYYATQVSAKPPTFVLFVNYPDAVHFSYRRYLANQFRAGTGITKVPVRLVFRERQRRDLSRGKKR